MSKVALLAAVLAGAAFCAAGCAGSTIHNAAYAGMNDVVLSHLDAGVSIDERLSNGATPLIFAVHGNNPPTVRLLLEKGADPAARDRSGRTARDYARHPEIKAMLASRPATSPAATAAAPASEKRAPVSDVDSPPAKAAERPDDFALVIGVEEYQSLPKADYGVRDAQTVRKHLEALGYPARNVVSLEGSQATASKLKSYLEEWLPLNVKPTSTLFVYYSGHGAPDPKSGDAYLVPWDGDPKFLKSTAYPLKKLYADLQKTKARSIVVALDACFSGAGGRSVLAQGARPLVAKVDDGVPASDRLTVLSAASGEEITGSLPEQGHGMFTYFLLKGLTEGRRTAKALHGYLAPRVQDEARRQNREQTPGLAGPDAPF